MDLDVIFPRSSCSKEEIRVLTGVEFMRIVKGEPAVEAVD
jgi:hypothetical protein